MGKNGRKRGGPGGSGGEPAKKKIMCEVCGVMVNIRSMAMHQEGKRHRNKLRNVEPSSSSAPGTAAASASRPVPIPIAISSELVIFDSAHPFPPCLAHHHASVHPSVHALLMM